MKFLLTSGGIENQGLVDALRELVGKDFSEAKLVFIPTAANLEEGDKWWVIKDLSKCKELGFQEVDIVDIAAVPKTVWLPRLQKADVIMVGGGNTSYLMGQIRKSGLADLLPGLLKTRVYVGVSAGSIITSPYLSLGPLEELYDDGSIPAETEKGMGFVPFRIAPHFNSNYFPKYNEKNIDKIRDQTKETLYAIDDQTAIKVVDGKVDVVTEGTWKKYN